MTAPSNSSLQDVVDDICITIFYLLPVTDFLSIQQTCNHFYKLLNPSSPIINNYWRLQSLCICDNIEITKYKSKKWYSIYQELLIILSKDRSFRGTTIANRDKDHLPPLFQACKYDCLHLFQLFASFKDIDATYDPNYLLIIDHSENRYWSYNSYETERGLKLIIWSIFP